MSYWACAQIQHQRAGLALLCLKQNGYEVYAPRLREQRVAHGRKVDHTPLLFPGYLFVWIQVQWSPARWSAGVTRLIMDGMSPATVPDAIIAGLKAREVGGLISLPKPPKYRPGDRVRILHGAFAGHVGLYAGMRPRDRVELLLAILGGSSRRVTLSADAVEPVGDTRSRQRDTNGSRT